MLQADLDNAEILLNLWPGMEYMLDEFFCENLDDLLPLGETNLVLCESPPQVHPEFVQEGLKQIVEKGFVPLIAHPERTQYFYEMFSQRVGVSASREKTEDQFRPDLESSGTPLSFIKKLLAPRAKRSAPRIIEFNARPALPDVCLFQASLGSFTGYYGPQVQSRAYDLLKNNVYTCIASYLHNGASAKQVLLRDKLDFNPLLKKLSDWDGREDSMPLPGNIDQARQRELFQQ